MAKTFFVTLTGSLFRMRACPRAPATARVPSVAAARTPPPRVRHDGLALSRPKTACAGTSVRVWKGLSFPALAARTQRAAARVPRPPARVPACALRAATARAPLPRVTRTRSRVP